MTTEFISAAKAIANFPKVPVFLNQFFRIRIVASKATRAKEISYLQEWFINCIFFTAKRVIDFWNDGIVIARKIKLEAQVS